MRVLWLTGTVGSGKTTIGAAVTKRLADSGEPAAFIDTDALGTLASVDPEDPFNHRVLALNLEAVAENYRSAGATTLVVAGVLKTTAELHLFEAALRTAVVLVRLILPADEVHARLRRRHGESDPEGFRWHSERVDELDGVLDRAGLAMTTVSNTGEPSATVEMVLATLG